MDAADRNTRSKCAASHLTTSDLRVDVVVGTARHQFGEGRLLPVHRKDPKFGVNRQSMVIHPKCYRHDQFWIVTGMRGITATLPLVSMALTSMV